MQNCKQIGNFLDIPKRSQAPKHIFWDRNMKNLETMFQIWKHLRNMKNMLTQILCRMDQTLFQTSSWGSDLKQNRFGIKFKNTVNTQSYIKCGSDFLNQKQLNMVLFENEPSKYYINIPVTVMVLPRIILTSLSLSWFIQVLRTTTVMGMLI